MYHNRAKLEGGFWNKEAQYPMKPAEAGSDLGGQREKGGGTSHWKKKENGNSRIAQIFPHRGTTRTETISGLAPKAPIHWHITRRAHEGLR